MVTNRFQWLLLLSAGGTVLGLLRGQEILALASLAILVWLFGEWLLFCFQVLFVVRGLRCERRVNDQTAPGGVLWSGRPVEIEARVWTTSPIGIPVLRVEDCLPPIMDALAGSPRVDAAIGRGRPVTFAYRVKTRAAGAAALPGFSLTLFDLHGLFYAQCFLPCRQQFRVLPMPAGAEGPRAHRKHSSLLPPPGIHRLLKAGMGGELLELREYVPGDPPKSIAWKVSARRDCLMIRQNESEVPIRTTLFVDGSSQTRYGTWGTRPIDEIVGLAASVARCLLSIRDPVGLTWTDQRQTVRLRPGLGERHYHQLLDELCRCAAQRPDSPAPLTDTLLRQAYNLGQRQYPELFRPAVNLVPWFWLPVRPTLRHRRRQRTQLATLLTVLYDLTPDSPVRLLFDDAMMSDYLHRFLYDAGYPPAQVSEDPDPQAERLQATTQSLLDAVARGRDNELFVLLVDLLDHPHALGRLTHAIRVATTRHHRVVVICPWPASSVQPPAAETAAGSASGLDAMLVEGERLRLVQASRTLRRELRRCGATVALCSDPQAMHLVLAQAELARSGRVTAL